MLTLRQLQYFEILSRHLHFGKAADECAVTQPALSMQIKELEAELGVTLIERSKSGVTLTGKGEEALNRVKTILRSVQDLQDFVSHKDKLLQGKLALGVIPTIAPYLLPRTLLRLNQQYPDLKLKLRESQTGKLIEELKQGRLDAVLLALPVDAEELTGMTLFTDHFLLATGKTNANSDPYDLISEQDLLLLEEGHCLRDQVLTFCREKKPDALSNFGASSLTTITQMIANGYGATLLPEIASGVELSKQENISILRFPDPQPQRDVGLIWRKTSPRSKDYEALGNLLREVGVEITGK